MPKLTYWVAPCLDDSTAYSIRDKTKKGVKAYAEKIGAKLDGKSFDPPKKVTVEYENAFDLVTKAVGEGGPYWEYR